jgi:MFS transporter, DHA2 family, multidrug resistance protein
MSANTIETPAPSPALSLPQINPWIVAIAVMCATFMEVLDTTVVNVSLPHIAGNLSATVDEATWVLTSYLVANAIVLPITGWLASRFGRKNLLMMSVVGFTISSFCCGLAPNLPFLVIFRILQGASGGCLQPLSQAVLLEAFPADQRGKAMAFWGFGIVVAPVLGPVMGGWLTDNYSWRWVFYINIPVGVLSILMTQRYIFDPPYLSRLKGRIDYWGIGLLALWVGALQVVLDKGQQEDWLESTFIRYFVVVTVAALIAFLIRELTIDDPVVKLSVLKNRTYTTGVFLMTVMGFVLYGSLVLLPVWLQTLLGYPSLQAGIALAPRGVGAMIGMPIVGIILGKWDPRKVLASGFALAAATLWGFSRLNLQAGYWDFFWPQFIQGFALSLLFVPLTTITMSQISRPEMGNATSLFNLTRNLGGSCGIAMVTTLYSRYTQKYINRLGESVTPFNNAASQWINSLRHMGMTGQQSVAAMFGQVQRQAAMLAFVELFVILSVTFVALIPLVFLMRRPAKGTKAEVGH